MSLKYEKVTFTSKDSAFHGYEDPVKGWIGTERTVVAQKALLGLPSHNLVGKFMGVNSGSFAEYLTKYIDTFSSSESAEVTFSRSGVGNYKFTIPTNYDLLDGQTIITLMSSLISGYTIGFEYHNQYVQVNLEVGGVLTDLPSGGLFTCTFELRTFE